MIRPPSSPAAADVEVVSRWLRAHGRPIDSASGSVPCTLPEAVRHAGIVGVALGFRIGHESLRAAHGIVHALVDAGFRALTLEGAARTSADLNGWLATGRGDVRALLAASQAFLHNAETLELLHRIRAHNVARPDDRIELVHSRCARTPTTLEQIELQLAETDLGWHARTGQRIAHLGGIAHLVIGPRSVSPAGAAGCNYGAHVADRAPYACVGVTVGTSTGPTALPPPPASFVEHALGQRTGSGLFIDLSSVAASVHAPPEVEAWLGGRLRTRCVGPDYERCRDAEFFVEAGPVAGVLNALAHIGVVTSAQPLPSAR